MIITQLFGDDVEQIGPLWELLNEHHKEGSTYFKEHFQNFDFAKRIAIFKKRECYTGFIVKCDEKAIAYCLASINDNKGEIDSIYIKPEYRKHHLGEKLIDKAEAWLRSKGASKIILGVAEGNESAHGFYQKQGYLPRTMIFEKTLD